MKEENKIDVEKNKKEELISEVTEVKSTTSSFIRETNTSTIKDTNTSMNDSMISSKINRSSLRNQQISARIVNTIEP